MIRLLSWGLPLATAAAYGWLVIGLGLPLQAMAQGLAPFDLRPLGYDLEAARAFLNALSPEAVALYLGPVARADTVFPILMGLTFLWWMRPATTAFGAVAATAALAYVALDLLENRVVAEMLRAGPYGVDAGMVRAASNLTMAKFAAFALAAVLAARAIWLRRQAGGTSQT
jgi:ABC-type amino acid transport system permease subunit